MGNLFRKDGLMLICLKFITSTKARIGLLRNELNDCHNDFAIIKIVF